MLNRDACNAKKTAREKDDVHNRTLCVMAYDDGRSKVWVINILWYDRHSFLKACLVVFTVPLMNRRRKMG